MAVEATYMNNLLPSQFLTNREIMTPNNFLQQQQQQQLLSSAMYNAQMNSAIPMSQPSAVAAMANNQSSILPFYHQQSNGACDPIKAESGLSYHNHQIPPQRKRSRDFVTEFASQQKNIKLLQQQQQQPSFVNNNNNQDALFQFQNQTQSEIDRVLAHHTEKVRMEMEEQKIRQSRVLLSVLQETMANKLKEKDEEIQRMEKLNMVLQERVRNLCLENQVWKELAHTNETTANYLRTNLEHILAHAAADQDRANRAGGAGAEDCESSCGSNGGGAAAAEEGEDTASTPAAGRNRVVMRCKGCGVRESVVLLLPCRHLCLCTICGSTVRNCPVCDSGMDASVHVNLS